MGSNFKHMIAMCHVMLVVISGAIKMGKSWCTNKSKIGVLVWLTTSPMILKNKSYIALCHVISMIYDHDSWVVNLPDITCNWIYFIYRVCLHLKEQIILWKPPHVHPKILALITLSYSPRYSKVHGCVIVKQHQILFTVDSYIFHAHNL